MSTLVKSEFVGLRSANEAAFNVQAVTAWSQNQPNPGGIQNYYPQYTKKRRQPLSPLLQNEKGDIVGLAVAPSIVHDANKDLFDNFGEQIMRSSTKFPGGTGVGRWMVANGVGGVPAPAIACTAVTATGYTVASGGAIATNVLVFARGFTNPANNGLKVTTASIGTEVKAAGLVVEAAPPVGATVEVVGVQGAAADITITAGLNVGATALNFTTLGLNVGQWIWIGGGTALAPGAFGFATAADRGFARITAIAAGQLTIDRKTQVFTADVGAGKTIQIFFGPWLRNVAGDHPTDYREISKSLEVAWPGAAAAGATSYQYGTGCCVDKFEFNSGLEDLTEATLSFVGATMTDPTTVRATQAANAMPNVATAAMNTVSEEKRLRVSNVDESGVSVDIIDWKLTVENNVKAQRQQGTLGAARMIFGKFEVMLEINCVFIQDDVCKAVSDNRTCMFEAAFRNNDFGVLFDVPSMTLSSGNPSIPANDAVTLATTEEAFRDSVYNYTLGLSLFPSLPAN